MDNQAQKKALSLEKHTDTYKLVIPADVEKKIRHLCNRISQVEWSGTLFYTHSGSYEEGTLEIRCVDIFPMDIGSQAYTEFDMSPDVIAYMTDHPELLDCQMGLIHSHNNMATFFSGTDTGTLREEGNDRNHFVSLIVNNAGTYTAAITRRLTEKRVINTTFTYRTFDDVEKTGTRTTEVEEEVIAYNMLNIIKEGEVTEPFLEIDERLEAIKKNKAKVVATKAPLSTTSYHGGLPFTPPTYQGNSKEVSRIARQGSLFDEEFMESEPPRKVEQIADPNELTIDASVVKSITLQLITGSIAIADASRIDPVKWAGQMTKLFDKRFEKDMSLFGLWAETMVEFVVTNFVPDEFAPFEDEYISELCQAVYMTLDKLPQNKYIKSIQDALVVWMK
jgi:hypothetical protein